MRKSIYYILFAMLPVCLPVLGQSSEFVDRGAALFETGFDYKLLKIEPNSEAANQFALPTRLIMPLGDRFVMNIGNTPAISWWYSDRSIGSISDTWVQGNYEMMRNRLILNMGMTLPTGKTRLDTNQYILSQAILARNLYQFALPMHGQDFSVKLGLMSAFALGKKGMFGLGIQYINHNAYHPVQWDYSYYNTAGVEIRDEWDLEYIPGDEIMVQAGLDWLIARNFSLSLDAFYTYYESDVLEGQEIFKSGQKIALLLDVYYKYSIDQYIRSKLAFRQRGKNELYQGAIFGPEAVNSNGPQLEWNFEGSILSNAENHVYYALEVRFNDQSQVTDSPREFMMALGAGARVRLNDSWKYNLQFQYLRGNIHVDKNYTINGLRSSAGLQYFF